jgi:hypothetical protein
MSIYYPTSVVFGEGQKISVSQDQGSTYLGFSYADNLSFINTLNITNPINTSVVLPTQANYPASTNNFFMGSFDGFWIHKLYLGDRCVQTIQTVNQDFFAAVVHDRIESVSMGVMQPEICSDCRHPHVPEPSIVLICIASTVFVRKYLLSRS